MAETKEGREFYEESMKRIRKCLDGEMTVEELLKPKSHIISTENPNPNSWLRNFIDPWGNNKPTRTMYVLQREDGYFYWKGNVSSRHDWVKEFDKAFLFQTKQGAKSRMFTSQKMSCEIREVLIQLK